jgi:hypothetical protein
MLRAVSGAVWSAILVILVLYAVLVGNFGTGALSTMRYPAVILMSSIPLRGSFLKRLDTFLIGIWFFTLFALVSVFLFYGQELLAGMWKKGKASLLLILVFVFVAAEWFYYGNLLDYFESYLCYLGVPLLVVLPAVLLVIGKAVKKK